MSVKRVKRRTQQGISVRWHCGGEVDKSGYGTGHTRPMNLVHERQAFDGYPWSMERMSGTGCRNGK